MSPEPITAERVRDLQLLERRICVEVGIDVGAAPTREQLLKAIDTAQLFGFTRAANRARSRRTCRICGCWECCACEGGCAWTEEDLCSACDPEVR